MLADENGILFLKPGMVEETARDGGTVASGRERHGLVHVAARTSLGADLVSRAEPQPGRVTNAAWLRPW